MTSILDYSNLWKNTVDCCGHITSRKIVFFKKNLKQRFMMNEGQLYDLFTNDNIYYLQTYRYYRIFESCAFYDYDKMDILIDKYRMYIYEHLGGNDRRIDLIRPHVLQERILEGTCINKEYKCKDQEDSIESNHLCCLKYFLEIRQQSCDTIQYQWDEYCLIDWASWHAQLEVVKYLFEVWGYSCTYCAIDRASANDKLEVVKYLSEVQKCPCSINAINWASARGNLEVVKYLFEVVKGTCTTYAIDQACVNGQFDVIKYLFEIQNCSCTENAIDNASRNGYLEIVKYLFEVQNCSCTVNAIDLASYRGRLDVVKYLFEVQKCSCTVNAINWASWGGHLDVIKYLFEIQNCSCTEDAINRVCWSYSPDVIKYLKDNVLK